MRSLKSAVIFSFLWLMTSSANAFDIVLNVTDDPGEGFNDNSVAFVGQTGNTGTTLGEQRLQVFQAAADYWETRLFLTLDVVVDISFDPLTCQSNSAVLGSAGADALFRDFDNAPRADTLYVSAVANNLAGRRLGSNSADISARFNSSIDNNNSCLNGTNWWLGIGASAPGGTIGLYDTVLHEIGHGLGVSSGIRQNGQLLAGSIDAYALYLYDETLGQYWRDMTVDQRVTSAVNNGNVTFRGPNAESKSDHITTGKTNGHLRVFAPNPYQGGSSISHWDTALVPDELMEPSATPTSDDRSTVQLLKDVGWKLLQDQANVLSGTIALSSSTFSANESQGTVDIQLSRTGGSVGAVSVLLDSSNGTALVGSDYTALVNQLVSWADGESGVKTIQLALTDDDFLEPDETVLLALSNVSGGAALGSSSATLTIDDDDTMVPGAVGFISTTLSADEDDGIVSIAVSRTIGSDGPVSVTVNSVNGTAISGDDFDAISNQVLSWVDGESGVKNVNLRLIDDALAEENENLTLSLSGVTGGASLGNSSASFTINNDDVAPTPEPGTVSFVSTSISADEDQGIVVIQLQRTAGSDGAVNVTVNTSDINANAGADYFAITNQMVFWADGDATVKTLNLRLINDAEAEADETFKLTISNPVGGVDLGDATTTVTIDSEDVSPIPEPGSISFVSSSMSVDETQGTVQIQLQRMNGFDGSVSVTLNSLNGSAIAGADYVAISNQVISWADGDQFLKSVSLTLIDDNDVEPDESFSLSLSNATGGVNIGAPNATVTIGSDDVGAGTIGFVGAAKTVAEDQGATVLEVERTGDSGGSVSVRVRSFDVSALTPDDYAEINIVLTWADGESGVRSIPLSVVDDRIVESDETVDFTLSEVSGGASISVSAFTLTITDTGTPVVEDDALLNTIASVIAAVANKAKKEAKEKRDLKIDQSESE